MEAKVINEVINPVAVKSLFLHPYQILLTIKQKTTQRGTY